MKTKAKNHNKVAHVGNLLTTKPHMTPMQIAKEVGCHVTLVYQVRKAIFVEQKAKSAKTKTMVHKAKVKKVVTKATEAVQEVADACKEVGLVDACKVLQDLVGSLKDVCVAFDHNRPTVEVLWHEELYDVDVADVPLAIDCIKYLKSKEKTYHNLNTGTGTPYSHLPSDYDEALPF